MPKRIEIVNPYSNIYDSSSYQCFGCSPHNKCALDIKFYLEKNIFYGKWQPENRFEGYHGIVHGGIQATLMDEAASWYIYSQVGTAGVTKSMDIEYILPTRVTSNAVYIKVSEINRDGNEVSLKTEIIHEDKVRAIANIVYFTFPDKIASQKYFYPGKEAFYK